MAVRPSRREAKRKPWPREASIFKRFGCKRYDSTARVDSTPVAVTVERTPGPCWMVCSRPRLEHTIQQGPGVLSTVTATGVLSTRAVESYRLHPNRLKMLASRGQGFLFASRRDGRTAIPVVYGRLSELPLPSENSLRRNDQARAQGLRLYEGLSTRSEETLRSASIWTLPSN